MTIGGYCKKVQAYEIESKRKQAYIQTYHFHVCYKKIGTIDTFPITNYLISFVGNRLRREKEIKNLLHSKIACIRKRGKKLIFRPWINLTRINLTRVSMHSIYNTSVTVTSRKTKFMHFELYLSSGEHLHLKITISIFKTI